MFRARAAGPRCLSPRSGRVRGAACARNIDAKAVLTHLLSEFGGPQMPKNPGEGRAFKPHKIRP